MPTKGLIFFFRKQCDGCDDESPRHFMHYEHGPPGSTAVYHTVGGRRRRGLIIDPGAANGLVGTETLRDLLANIDNSNEVQQTLLWKTKQSEVTGISGEADKTMGEIQMSLPMIPGNSGAVYKADVIGGAASMCPALVGNPSLVKMKAIIASNWFQNQDGLLIAPEADGNHQLIRLLLTDSKHYLLPLDEDNDAKVSSEESSRARTFLTTVESQSKKKWTDVRVWYTRPEDKPKPKRSQDDTLQKEETSRETCSSSPTAATTLDSELAGFPETGPTDATATHHYAKDHEALFVSPSQLPPRSPGANKRTWR